jgi:hypothetical protein
MSHLAYFVRFSDRVSLCSPSWPQTHDPSASASWVLRLQKCTTTPGISVLDYCCQPLYVTPTWPWLCTACTVPGVPHCPLTSKKEESALPCVIKLGIWLRPECNYESGLWNLIDLNPISFLIVCVGLGILLSLFDLSFPFCKMEQNPQLTELSHGVLVPERTCSLFCFSFPRW